MSLDIKKYQYNGVMFDDFLENYEDGRVIGIWTQVCQQCVNARNIPTAVLDIGIGSGICGVEGCENESDHHLDFPQGEASLCSSF